MVASAVWLILPERMLGVVTPVKRSGSAIMYRERIESGRSFIDPSEERREVGA
jgi:hypothetical protein